MKPLKLIFTTDVHGAIYPHTYHDNQPAAISLSRLQTYLKTLTGQTYYYFDNGDILQGTPFSDFCQQHQTPVSPIAQALNTLKISGFNLGNHDFNYGQHYLFNFLDSLDCPLLTCNVFYKEKALGQPLYLHHDDQTIAVIGLSTQYIPHWEQPEHLTDFTFASAFDTLKTLLPEVKQRADAIIVMYHGGFECDLESGEPTERLTGENEGYRMLDELTGITAFISGHQHRLIATTFKQTVVLQGGFQANHYMELSYDGQQWTGALIEAQDIQPDAAFLEPFNAIEQQVQSDLDAPIGTLKNGPILITDQLQARLHKHPFVSLINQVQAYFVPEADLSMTSLFNNSFGLPQAVSKREIVANFIFPNTLVLKRMRGKDIRLMLEKNAAFFTLDAAQEIIIDPSYYEPKLQLYNYDMVDGLTYTLDITKPLGSRLTQCDYQGQPLKDSDELKIVMNNYRATGGGDFEMIQDSPTLAEVQNDMVSLMEAYFKVFPIVEVNHHDNIHVIKGAL